jgi:uncharacterized Zn finger protein
MKFTGPAPYDEARLRKAAGEKVFARGQDYADHGQVSLLSASADGVLAAAFGTMDYTVWLKRPGPEVSGHCTCPAFEDAGLCKHLVAAALLANEAADAGDSPSDSVGEVAAHIAGLDRRQLEKLLLEMAMADWRALRSLHFALGFDWEDDLD